MSDVVIQVENLSKRYRLGLIGRTSLHEDLARWWARMQGKPDPSLRLDQLQRLEAAGRAGGWVSGDDPEHVWALRDVSFEVKRGEVIGIIGRNGAGKSTLLKILTKVTSPTLGEVRMKGRVASLLEVGTGFHPELTGRENIFLNGAIMGMSRVEIKSRFDEIVAFAEVDKFIDTPVKRYSSGMYVRLAFAIAAHLEPEILLVDEVLAVGDMAFQQKCIGKMGEVARGGRTVLFVSHNMGSIKTLCSEVIWLAGGGLAGRGTSAEMVERYLQETVSESGLIPLPPARHRVLSPFQIESIEILDGRNNRTSQLLYGDEIQFKLTVRNDEPIEEIRVGIELFSGGLCVTSFHTPAFTMPVVREGKVLTCRIPRGSLMPGNFEMHVGAHGYRTHKGLDWVPGAAGFRITNIPAEEGGRYDRRENGVVRVPAEWEGIPIRKAES